MTRQACNLAIGDNDPIVCYYSELPAVFIRHERRVPDMDLACNAVMAGNAHFCIFAYVF